MTRGTRGWGLAAAAVFAVLVSTLSAQQTTGTVTGRVLRGGNGVAGARVVIDSGSDSTYTRAAATDSNGTFTITDAPVGPIGVKVYDDRDKLLTTARTVLRRAGDTVTLNLQVS
jgi:hypothetical protein